MSSQGPLPYLAANGAEIANAARTLSYMRAGLANTMQGHWIIGGGDVCDVLYRLNGGNCIIPDIFVSPAADPAPWYDPLEPGAATFLGVVLLDLNGYASTITRVVSPRVQGLGGATFSGQRREPRTWTFRAALVSADDAGAEFGLRWLTSVLETSSCANCDTGDLTVRLVCPPADCSDETLGEWTSYEVVLTNGPNEVEKWSPKPASMNDVLAGCRDFVTVEWTMVAGNPFLYKAPVECLPAELIGADTACNDICDFLFGPPGDAHCCAVAAPARGTIGAIFTLTSLSGMGGVILGGYDICPVGSDDGDPVLSMSLSGVPANSTLVVDCSQRTVLLTQVDPDTGQLVTTDATYLLDIGETGIEWIEVRDCDTITCLCARTAHPCSQGGDTTIAISTQLREG